MFIYFFIAILFSVFTSANFFIRTGFFATAVSTDLTALFSSVPYVSIIAIPALCYRNQTQEYRDFIAGSNFTKIFHRFLHLTAIFSAMVFLLIVPCIFVSFTGNVDFGQIFTSMFCLILYGATAISLCIFANELISNPILGFVLSAIVLSLSNSAHSVLLYVNPNQFFSDALKTFSFAWHFDAASKGIFDSRDIFFFLILGGTLLYFTDAIIKIRKGWIFSKSERYEKIIVALISILLIMNFQNFYFRADFSKSKNYSISKYTHSLLERIDGQLKITYYRSSSLSKYYPQIRDVSDFLTLYSNQSKKISFIIKNPDKDEQVKKILEDYGITSRQLKAVKNTSTEYVNVFSAIAIEYNGKTELIPFIMDSSLLEFDLDGRIHHLITEKERIVNIIIGNGMNLQEDYGYVVPWLNSNGFICNEINIYGKNFSSELENASGPLLVIGDANISTQQATQIERYILMEKGNAFFAVSPFSSSIETDWSITKNPDTPLIDLLSNAGVEFSEKICGDLQCSRIQLYTEEDSSPFSQNSVHTENVNYPLWIKIPGQENFVSGMTLFWAVPMNLKSSEKISCEPYIYTGSTSFSYDMDETSDSLFETNPFVLRDRGFPKNTEYKNQIVAAKITGDLKGFYDENIDLHSGRSQIIVLSDPYFVNSLMTGYNSTDYADYRNFDFLTNTLLRLNGENELADLQNKKSFDNSLNRISDENQYMKLQRITYLTLFALIPLLLLVSYIFVASKNKFRYKEYFFNETA